MWNTSFSIAEQSFCNWYAQGYILYYQLSATFTFHWTDNFCDFEKQTDLTQLFFAISSSLNNQKDEKDENFQSVV